MIPVEVQNRRNTSSVETFFDGLLRGADKLTENLFFGELPTTIKDSWNELAVVDCGNPQYDHGAYSSQTVLVLLYVKQNAYGKKDVKTLQSMEEKLNELILGSEEDYYDVSIRGRYSNYDAVNDIYYNIVQINLIIT